MLMKIWTGSLLFLAWLSFCAWLVLVCREKNVHPLRDFAAFFKKQTTVGRILFGTFFLIMWVYASVKPGDGGGNGGGDGGGDGGTNNVPQMVGPPGGSSQMSLPGGTLQPQAGLIGQHAGLQPVRTLNGGTTLNLSGLNPITSTNTLRTITAEDFERGFVQTRVGTDEQFDFSPITNATIVSDWRAFGAATDWIYVALTNWAFQVATNDVERLRVYAFGKIEPLIREADNSIATNYWFAPFMASLGVVPQANWDWLSESDRPSQVWYAITPENSLVITWQNALLDRDTANPLSFQVEFKTNGKFTYRYDLSRLNANTVTNILSGASFGGNGWTTNAIPTNVTSMVFYPLTDDDAYNQDPDNDGLLTIDELFFYDTDPRNPDTDYDGLTDYEDLFIYNTNPLNPHSVSDTYCDGIAVKIGDIDPFSYPEGSTNTVLEHVFYSGTTNGVFAYPTSTVETAVLKIMVSGSGTGRLVIGDAVVPLIAQPPLRSGAQTNILFQTVERGVIKTFWWDKPDGLDVAVEADEFLIGELPSLWRLRGWIAFPHTDATVPCIHDFYAKGRMVTLVHGVEFPGLTAEWASEESGVAITNVPPVSAAIYGSFPKSATRTISYTLNHPNQLNSTAATFTQTLRFCPQLEDDDEPTGGSGGGGDEEPEYWNCECGWNGSCSCCAGEWCHCSSWDCPCNNNQSPTLDDNDDEEEDAYTNIVNGVLSPLSDVLYLYRSNSRTESLPVPGGPPKKCCPCPEHWASNYVAKVSYSSRVAVKDAAGNDFNIAYEPCTVTVSGVSPSREFRDSTINFVTNGASYKRTDYTVLGVKFELEYDRPELSSYNLLSSVFGFPIPVCTNLTEASTIMLRTDVLLTNGVVKLSILNATGDFQVWLPGWEDNNANYHAPELLLSSDNRPERHFSIRRWREIIRRYGSYNGIRTLPVKVLSSSQGHCDLKLEYAASNGTGYVHDYANQRITSVNPPLLPDYNHDGRIDAADRAYFIAWLPYRFWTNQDTCKGDDVLSSSGSALNCDDDVVNGTLDLINFFPIAIDTAPFLTHWGNSAVTFSVGFDYDTVRLKGCFVNCPWNNVGSLQTNATVTVDNQPLSSALLTRIGSPITLANQVIAEFDSQSGVLFAEALMPTFRNIVLRVMCNGEEFFKVRLPMHVIPVRQMYYWHNYRAASGGSVSRASESVGSLNHPYGLENAKKFFFLHGANVSEENAEKWGDAIFKRLWHAGCHVEFHNVDWRSDIGGSANYQQNASNAFAVASVIATDINAMSGDKVIMAHSLGNMVVSSMIQDHGLQVEKYMMCDSAVPAEAYDTTLSPTNLVVHPEWDEYPRRSFANEWYRLFLDDSADDRRKLTWEGRFPMIRNVAVNFYSSKDHVLELFPTNVIGVADGYENWDQMFERYSWQKQELWKGRKGILARMGTTDWSGWSIRKDWLGNAIVDPSNALYMAESVLKTNTVFKLQPASMNTNSIPRLVLDAHLTQGIPARTPATGLINICNEQMLGENFNLNSTDDEEGIPRPNGWPTRTLGWLFTTTWTDEWLHSDMKDVSYFYTYKFYEKVKQKGELP